VLLVLLTCTSFCKATVYYVSATTGANSTCSQQHPCSSIGRALTLAHRGDIVRVLPGTYNENVFWGDADKTVISTAGAGSTFINGGWGTGVFFGPQMTYWVSNISRASVLDGFTVQNGDREGYYGGGVSMIAGSSPTIRNCVFSNNQATWGGGNVYVEGSSSSKLKYTAPLIENCFVTKGYGANAGGIGVSGVMANATFVNVTVSSNQGMPMYRGGGVFVSFGGSATFVDSLITGNSGASGAGVYVNGDTDTVTSLTLIRTKVVNNTATGSGGGLYCYGPTQVFQTDSSITGNTPDNIYGCKMM